MNGAWFIRVKAVVPQSRDGWVSTSNDPVIRLNWRSSFWSLILKSVLPSSDIFILLENFHD